MANRIVPLRCPALEVMYEASSFQDRITGQMMQGTSTSRVPIDRVLHGQGQALHGAEDLRCPRRPPRRRPGLVEPVDSKRAVRTRQRRHGVQLASPPSSCSTARRIQLETDLSSLGGALADLLEDVWFAPWWPPSPAQATDSKCSRRPRAPATFMIVAKLGFPSADSACRDPRGSCRPGGPVR
jgi:hypothetical protein